uniref:Putative LOC100883390 [Megachile rotundata] n=1 Tax=Lepeophtheirus salmonis TaxID=72036 RepID=A0A0K2T7F7_LEPSM
MNVPESENCHYTGKVRGQKESRVALSNCDGSLNGIIFDGSNIYHVQDDSIYDDRHRLEKDHRCGFPESDIPNRFKRHINTKKHGYNSSTIHKKGDMVRKPWKANKNSRYVELILVVDNKEYNDHGRNLMKVHRLCKDIANVMNALYSPLNIYIALVGVIVWTEYDEITLDRKGDQTLTHFLHYRRERLVKEHPNDNAQLLTGIEFEGGVVGKALKGPICTYEFSGGVNMWHSNIISLVATTVAHELGHNFGMEHDDEDCSCPDERCIMAPASSTMKPSFWSSCSLNHLALAFEQGMDYCLRNKPVKLFGAPVCGNGFVEEGEDCDCGLKHHCDTTCCDPDSCTLTPGSLCATGECCDFDTCKPKAGGVKCRDQDQECDLSEYCTGDSEFCPTDVNKADGTSCKGGSAFCYSGSCRTHTDQCKLLWGPSGRKSDNQCYELNAEGSRKGNCGYHRVNDSYAQCKKNDVRCGMLHCSHYNEKLEFGMEKVSILSHSFINTGGEIIPCRTAIVDLGINDVDPGLAPEGSRCDDGSLCVNRKCMPVASLRIGPDSCYCNGRGVCNSMGHCHCVDGFAPPDCFNPGLGGSIDSGPAGLIKIEDSISTPILAVFIVLGLIPLLCICIFGAVVATKWRKKRHTSDTVESDLPVAPRKGLSHFKIQALKLFKRNGNESDSTDSGRYDKIAISGPTLVSATSDSVSTECSSPTHALLPNSNGVKTKKSPKSKNSNENVADENPTASVSPPLTDNEEVSFSGSNSNKRGFLSNINKSIKSLSNDNRLKKYFSRSNFMPAGDAPKYQIKVEKRVDDATQQDDLVLSPASSSIEVNDSNNVQLESSLNKNDDDIETPPPSYNESVSVDIGLNNNKFRKSKTLPPIHVNYANNPKLAFPYSSSYEAAFANVKCPPPPLNGPKQEKVTSPTKPDKRSSNIIIKKLNPVLSQQGPDPTSPTSHSKKLKISKPVLKTATPCAESLISKAPSTGISQSSILAIKKELSNKSNARDREKRSSRGVVFCDPLTLPSPTNPNSPAIIHQPSIQSNSPTSPTEPSNIAAPPATTVTPFWSKTESPKRISDNDFLHIDVAPIASPESDRIVSGNKVKISKSSVAPPPPPPRANEQGGSRRNIPISSPILKSQIELKTNLVPVKGKKESKSKPSDPPSIPPLSTKPKIHSSSDFSPKSPLKSLVMGKDRPSSIGPVGRPSSTGFRPSDPPPPRPASERNTSSTSKFSRPRGNVDDDLSTPELSPIFKMHASPDTLSTSSSNEGGDLLKEILMDADKKAEAETGEFELYSTLMRKKKGKKGGKSGEEEAS